MAIRRRRGGGGDAPVTGPTQPDQSEEIVRGKSEPPTGRQDPDQEKTTVQILHPLRDDHVGIGQLRITGSTVKSATFNPVGETITFNLIPRFDYTIDFGLTEKSVS